MDQSQTLTGLLLANMAGLLALVFQFGVYSNKVKALEERARQWEEGKFDRRLAVFDTRLAVIEGEMRSIREAVEALLASCSCSFPRGG